MNLKDIIENRRTIKPERYTGEAVPNSIVKEVLKSANWAPTHGFTEPWRFVVYTEDKKQLLLSFLNRLDQEKNGANEIRKEKRAKRFKATSHLIAIVMKRGDNPKIPEIEELLAVGCAVQNMWLTAHEKGLGAYWSTGGLAYLPELTEFLGFDAKKDKALGFLYIGDPVDGIPKGNRLTSIDEKTRWA